MYKFFIYLLLVVFNLFGILNTLGCQWTLAKNMDIGGTTSNEGRHYLTLNSEPSGAEILIQDPASTGYHFLGKTPARFELIRKRLNIYSNRKVRCTDFDLKLPATFYGTDDQEQGLEFKFTVKLSGHYEEMRTVKVAFDTVAGDENKIMVHLRPFK